MTLVTFIFFTALVAFLTWWMTRGKGTSDETGYFLAGRSLTAPFIAGSLLLTNLSTEQLVGLNAGAFGDGLSVMAWEVVAGASLVLLALFFLPRYLKSGITTIPQFLEERYGGGVRSLVTITFIVAYMLILPAIRPLQWRKGVDRDDGSGRPFGTKQGGVDLAHGFHHRCDWRSLCHLGRGCERSRCRTPLTASGSSLVGCW